MVEMDELIAINVRYEGDNEASQIFQLNPKTQWRDLEAMLKVQYDCENVEVFYVDTDGDYIILSSQEELVEAFKVAQNCSSTLHLKLRNFTGQPVEPETHRGDNTPQTPGGDTDVKIMMESSVDPKSEHQQNTGAQKEQEGDSSEAELEKLEMWLHEDSKPLIRSKEVEKQMAPTVDIVTPSEDEKKEAGEVKPSDGQKDEETGVVYVKPKVMRQKVRKSEKTLEHDRMYKRRHCRSAERSRRLRYEEEAETSDDAAMPELLMAADFLYDVTIPDGTRVQPGTRLMKTWRIRNAGTSKWTDSTKLKVVYDCIPTVQGRKNVPKLRPAEEGEITVELVAPQKPEPKEVLEPTKDDTFKLVQQSQQAENLHQKSEYEEIPERDVKISQKEDFLLEPSQTSFRSSEEIEKREPGEGEENIKIVMADSVAEIADKMVEFVCEQMDRSEARNVEHFMPENNNVETIAPDNEPKYVDQEKENVDSGIPVEFARHQEVVSDTGNKYESTGKSGDESDFSDGHGFLHVQGPDLIAFEMVEPGEDDKYENALPVEEEKFENAEEYLNDRKEEVQIEERQVLSRSSSVEVVDMTQDESAADEEVQDHEYLRSLQNPVTVTVNEDEDDDDDDDSMTDSSYDIYNDSEDDFLVVPMPACFNLEKPISFQQPESQSEDERGDNLDDNHNRIHVADEQTRVSVDDILTTSGTIATPPLEPEAVAMPTQEVDDKTMIKKEADLDDFFGTESVEKDNLVSASETDSEETKVVEITQHPGPADKLEEVTSPVVTTQPEGATAMEAQWDKQLEQRPAELVNQMMHTAVKAANKAAANANAFYTWQARTYQNASGKTNSYKPPTSSWKPKESDFKPPQSDWKPKDEANKEAEPWKAPNADYKPPKSEWKPKSDKWQPPKEAGPMAKLKEMGFCNRELNEKLLKKHNDDVETVVQELLSTTENDWMAQRH
ncbi:NBR1 [Mytilus edulis]|uniref:NBR1 n=1 Tax=Mytilus edulis TaxID=6550 RepID=A0A8S3SZG8_MYTED|nr:NBR1 [Mytilus edulis]